MNDDDRFDTFDQALEAALRARVAMAEVNATRWVRCPDNGCTIHAGHLDGYARTADGQLIVEHQGDDMNPLQRMRLAESPLKAARYDGDAGPAHIEIDDEKDPRFVPKDLRGRAPHSNPTDVAFAQRAILVGQTETAKNVPHLLVGDRHATDLVPAHQCFGVA